MQHILNWYNRQLPEIDFHRVGMIALVLLLHMCIIVPATLLTISMNGNNIIEFTIMMVLGFSILVSLLGDMPAKVVIPLFIISTIVHIGIILTYLF